ncbi:MAG: DsbE family thiol:disulfide interchange protein [Rhizobiales bacterium]|nr:DsbE family thiol:disulfide interchange protein [Hyphomicrobiales bacterium]
MNADSTLTTTHPATARTGMRSPRFRYLIPVTLFIALAMILGWALAHNPREIPSALIGKSVPQFSLRPVQGRTLGLSASDLIGEASLVNVFASWCVACREEHPLLMRMKADGVVPIHGLNYKDRPDNAARWLNTLGDPYTRTGVDRGGRVAIDWGVYGVPETFVITKDGHIAHKHIGPLTPKDLDDTILPLIRRLQHQ